MMNSDCYQLIQDQLCRAHEQWCHRELSDSEMAICFFTHRFAIQNLHKKLANFLLEDDPCKSLSKFQFKKVKAKVLDCLLNWSGGRWNLVLGQKVYTPYEVLEFQSKGIRPVSMLFDKKYGPIRHRKDSLDFFIHDLEHGYMFFHDQQFQTSQFLSKSGHGIPCAMFVLRQI